jgi:hypothetical protein
MSVKICRQRRMKGEYEGVGLGFRFFVLRLGWPGSAGVCGLGVGRRKNDGGVKKKGRWVAVTGGASPWSMFGGGPEGKVKLIPMMLVHGGKKYGTHVA